MSFLFLSYTAFWLLSSLLWCCRVCVCGGSVLPRSAPAPFWFAGQIVTKNTAILFVLLVTICRLAMTKDLIMDLDALKQQRAVWYGTIGRCFCFFVWLLPRRGPQVTVEEIVKQRQLSLSLQLRKGMSESSVAPKVTPTSSTFFPCPSEH